MRLATLTLVFSLPVWIGVLLFKQYHVQGAINILSEGKRAFAVPDKNDTFRVKLLHAEAR